MTDTPAPSPGAQANRPRRTLIVLLSAVAALVLLALVVVLTRGAPAELERGTPEAVVQEYARAVLDGRLEEARGHLYIEERENCEPVDPDARQLRVALRRVSIDGPRAFVHVVITTSASSGPFGGGGYQVVATFELRNDGGHWLIRSAPWQFTVCYFAERG